MDQVLTAAVVFAGTNVDDLVVLTLLFLATHAGGGPRPAAIWLGQYLGIAVLVGASAVMALGLAVLPDGWIRFLGLIPLLLGVLAVLRARRRPAPADVDADPPAVRGLLAVAGVTIANGGDNLAVYTPLLRTAGLTDALVTVAAFAVLVALWCLAGSWLGGHRRVIAVVERTGPWLTPAVFITLGTLILLDLL